MLEISTDPLTFTSPPAPYAAWTVRPAWIAFSASGAFMTVTPGSRAAMMGGRAEMGAASVTISASTWKRRPANL